MSSLRIPPGHSLRISPQPDGSLLVDATCDMAAEGDRILTVRETAERLRVSERTVRGYLARRRRPLPHSKVGGAVRIFEKDLDSWVR